MNRSIKIFTVPFIDIVIAYTILLNLSEMYLKIRPAPPMDLSFLTASIPLFCLGRNVRKDRRVSRSVYCSLFGRYSQEKAQHILIEAAKLSKYAENLQLIFAGDGPYKEKLKKQASNLPVPPLFRFFGREELADVISYADLYVHTAEIEIESVACLEAICGGLLPIIADSPRSATRYFALTQNNLFRYDSPQELSEKIDYWIEHEEEKRICLENISIFLKNLPWTNV